MWNGRNLTWKHICVVCFLKYELKEKSKKLLNWQKSITNNVQDQKWENYRPLWKIIKDSSTNKVKQATVNQKKTKSVL